MRSLSEAVSLVEMNEAPSNWYILNDVLVVWTVLVITML